MPFGKDKGTILRCDPITKKTDVIIEDSPKSNGLKFDAKGFPIACENDGGIGVYISRLGRMTVEDKKQTVGSVTFPVREIRIPTDWGSHRKKIAHHFNGTPDPSPSDDTTLPSDLTIDRRGRIYFINESYMGSKPHLLKHYAVYRVDPKGGVREVMQVPEKANGIALSPDERTLYIADYNNGADDIDHSDHAPKPGAMKVHAFPLDADGRVKGPGKVLIDFGKENGCDGITVDVKGNLYLAGRSLKRPGIWVIDKDGKELAYIPTGLPQPDTKKPKGIPSKCCFGDGAERNVLYITVDTGLCCIPLKVNGYRP